MFCCRRTRVVPLERHSNVEFVFYFNSFYLIWTYENYTTSTAIPMCFYTGHRLEFSQRHRWSFSWGQHLVWPCVVNISPSGAVCLSCSRITCFLRLFTLIALSILLNVQVLFVSISELVIILCVAFGQRIVFWCELYN